MRRPIRTALAVALLLAPTTAAAGASWWNDCGHRVIAAVAYEQLDPGAREAIADLLGSHPAAGDPLWLEDPNRGDDPALSRFMSAAVFPDDARRPGPFKPYDVGRAHYVNFRIVVGEGGATEILPPLDDPDDDDDPHRDVLRSLATNLATARDRSADPAARALALSWIAHQVGDLHQPLHNVARFGPATPGGDRGGNDVRLGDRNLHGYWDWALCGDPAPENVAALAAGLIAEHPREPLADRLAEPDVVAWSREGVELALRYAYRDLDPTLAAFPDLPIGYAADARSVARRQCALAGYRLADLLRSVVPLEVDPGPAPD